MPYETYETYIELVPEITKKLIKKAMDIYALIQNNCETKHLLDVNFQKQDKRLTANDKICYAFFLASFLIPGKIKKIMENNGIQMNEVLSYFELSENAILPLSSETYKNYYEDFDLFLEQVRKITVSLTLGTSKNSSNDFDLFVGRFKDPDVLSSHIELDIENLQPEYIIYNLYDSSACSSTFVHSLYLNLGWMKTPNAKKHYSYLSLRTLVQKLISIMNEQVDDELDIQDMSSLDLPNKESGLTKYGIDITDKKYLDNPAIGREAELRELMRTLLTIDKNPILVGEAGVGKTSIIRGLAYLINKNLVPNNLKGTKIIQVNVSSLLSGTIYRGQFEERVESLVRELIKAPNTLLYIDEMHMVMGAGSTEEKGLDLANMLKPYLDDGMIRLIGATTSEEYDAYIARDSAFRRRFEKITIKEPDNELVEKILEHAITKYEQLISVQFIEDVKMRKATISLLSNCSDKKHRVYNNQINNPDLAIALLQRAFAGAAIDNCNHVEIQHIIDAIKYDERINPSAREKQLEKFQNEIRKEDSSLELPSVISLLNITDRRG